nr:RNA-directed DNA polymerase, eukaryota, reverse transcriptase zinc-binding domain protein [Tanacetum cinerariifolium]
MAFDRLPACVNLDARGLDSPSVLCPICVMVDGEWVDDPCRVKEEFRLHFANRFRAPVATRDEVCNAVWGCVENKSPGPDGYSFEFFRKFWDTLGSEFCEAVEWAIEAGFYKGIKIGSSLNLSHLFYADDAVFIGEWSPTNLSGITHILHCFSLLSGLSINIQKSHLLGVGVRSEYVTAAALNLGCLTMKTPFKYLGVMVGGNCSTSQAWEDTIGKLKARLSNWKLKTLSVGGRLTLLKSVLGNFVNGVQCDERKIAWIKRTKILASKKNGGLGVSSLYALNKALLFKWVWRFISRDNSLWRRFITTMHGSNLSTSSPFRYSSWLSIIREIHSLKDRGVDLLYHFRIHVGNGLRTSFWKEVWIGDNPLCVLFPRIYALEENKDCSVAEKLYSASSSLRRPVRGVFCVKDVRNLLDDPFLPKAPIATRWIKYVPIKLNVFAWKVHLDRLSTRVNLQHRGVLVSDPLCLSAAQKMKTQRIYFFGVGWSRILLSLSVGGGIWLSRRLVRIPIGFTGSMISD